MTAHPGRPPGPTEHTADQVLQAALRVLLDEGAEAMTFQRISDETGVARSTIYRHWPNRASFVATMPERATFPYYADQLTGELRPDLNLALDTLVWRFANRPVRQFYAALVAYCRQPDDGGVTAESYMTGC